MMAGAIYTLCAMTALLCSVLLFQAYRRSGYRLLFWGGMCFAGLALNNALLVVDKLMFPDIDLSTARLLSGVGAMIVMLYGLIWHAE
jgi:hypothetical protein